MLPLSPRLNPVSQVPVQIPLICETSVDTEPVIFPASIVGKYYLLFMFLFGF